MPCSDNGESEYYAKIAQKKAEDATRFKAKKFDHLLMVYKSLYAHHLQMERELEQLRDIAFRIRNNQDIMNISFPAETKPWMPMEEYFTSNED